MTLTGTFVFCLCLW